MVGQIVLRGLESGELGNAAKLLARGMCDNPNNVRTFGPDAGRRKQALARMFLPVLRRTMKKGQVSGAFQDGALVGVCAAVVPGSCQLGAFEKLAIAPSILLSNPPAAALRLLRWLDVWAWHDPHHSHWHLGPVSADAHLRSRGIGSAMLRAFCEEMDARGQAAYLETDRPENIAFYEKFGFLVTGEEPVHGAPNWFMQRPSLGEGRAG